jgi:hypothetical protein
MEQEHIEQMVRDLRKEGFDCYTISRKLELTVLQVEEIVYRGLEIDPEQIMSWMGAHH